MPKRPYFKLGVDSLEELYKKNKGDEVLLKSLAAELVHRTTPKAKALQRQVAQSLAHSLSGQRPVKPLPSILPRSKSSSFPVEPQNHPSRVGVECGKCGTTNFISTLEDVTQHLSCSACKTSYEAVFKYGVLRTKFDITPEKSISSRFALAWMALIAIAIIIGFFLAK